MARQKLKCIIHPPRKCTDAGLVGQIGPHPPPPSPNGQHDDGNGRHDDGKGQQGNRRHNNADGRHDDGKGQQGNISSKPIVPGVA